MKLDIENWSLIGQIIAFMVGIAGILTLIVAFVKFFGSDFSWVDYIALIGGFAGILGGIAAFLSYLKAFRQVKMITDRDEIGHILPLSLIHRMTADEWHFGIVTTGDVIWAVTSIRGISDDKEWLEVKLNDEVFEPQKKTEGLKIITATGDRTTANIKISHIVGAIEFAST